MPNMGLSSFLFLSWIVCLSFAYEDSLLGCFKSRPQKQIRNLPDSTSSVACTKDCADYYYRYSNFYNQLCTCTNYLGEQISNSTCNIYCSQYDCDPSITKTDVYTTGNILTGPPRILHVSNITNSSCNVFWKEPESYVQIVGYQIKALIVKTFSNYAPNTPAWYYGNDTNQIKIPNLLPATKYNITVNAVSEKFNDGPVAFQIIVTKIGEPDNVPPKPVITENNGDTMKVKFSATPNNNGPVSTYRVIVGRAEDNSAFHGDNVMPYKDAQKNGASYYVTAEIKPEDIEKEFIVGDGKKYGQFYNAPLDPDTSYNVILGLVSSFGDETKVIYSMASGYTNGVSILNVYDESKNGDNPGVIIGLSVAIGLLTFMLIAGIIGFIILKSKIINRRQRLSDNQELTLQGPMIEVENNGYIHEEEHIPAIKHYRNLKQKVRTIPASQIKVESTNLLGIGKFARVNTGTLHENDTMTTVTCYSIFDKKMNQETKKSMLQELDLLIKTGQNDNIVNLIGTSETPQMVVVVMEYCSMNLKDLLLSSRDHFPGKFSNMSESQALDIALGVCRGMAHLHSVNIVHKQLCSRSVMISNSFVPKIGSFGLAQYFSHNKIPDYTRWTAYEVFKDQPHTFKSDVWSFACILWEICSLGGTPYGNIPNNNDIPDSIGKGLRLPQFKYISDELYQILLDCWQLIPDERPTFQDLLESLQSLQEQGELLCFTVYSNFQYEQFYPDMELSLRPVF